jgi:hypothetical protein
MIQRVPKYCWIDFSRWIGIAKVEDHDGQWYECYWLKLPSYGWHYQINYDVERWSQLVWFWHGKHGFRAFWLDLPDQPGDKRE